MIWIKRFLPIVVISVTALAYYLWDKNQTANRIAREDQLALVTAQVWIGTALYREDPDRYLIWRDSLLEAFGVERDELFEYLDRHDSEPEQLIPLARLIQQKVDSLGRIEDSLFREARIQARDSALAAERDTSEQ